MIKKGFSKEFSAAVTAASSAVSPVIPPGTNLILYALIANVPVGDMFLAGYTPGILMTAAMMVTVYIISKKRGYEPSRERMARPSEILKQAIKSIWALAIPFGIIMGMRIGIFTPTEAGGAVGAMLGNDVRGTAIGAAIGGALGAGAGELTKNK